MGLTLITGPSEPLMSVLDLREHLRSDDHDDRYVSGLIGSATAMLDGKDGLLGRALQPQTWRQTFDCFGARLDLRLPPLRSVIEVTYLDTAGAEQTLAPEAYLVRGVGEDAASIHPAIGQTWPSTADFPSAVSVVFEAGYDTVPPIVRQAVMLQVATWFAYRESVAVTSGLALQIDGGVSEMLRGLKVRRF